mmetsp:Transcript_72469/g.132685  ORF Transcript_72469/g.132685 Transcript_72469/m.132685 type:complete len:373 (+) Transcript_72469:137-1255(+)
MAAEPSSRLLQPVLLGREYEEGPLWSTIKRQLYRSEVAHVKRLVGESLIQQNRVMWDEINSLRQILTDFQEQNEELSERVKSQVQFCGSQHRDLLRRQSHMILQDVRAQAESSGHVLDDLLPELREDDQLRQFIMAKDKRSGSKGSVDGFTPPQTPSTRPSSASGCSTPEPLAGAMPVLPLGRHLSVDELGTVAAGVREALDAEHLSLLAIIGEQMEHLEAEADQRASTKNRLARGEPSTAKLQQFVHKLQDLAVSPTLRTLTLANTDGSASPPSPTPIAGGSNVRRLQALIASRRLRSPPGGSGVGSLGAVPEQGGSPVSLMAGPRSPGGYPSGIAAPPPLCPTSPSCTPSGKSMDPFFDDPLFAAAVSQV